MKRNILSALLILSVVGVEAQNMSDALNFSENFYVGTARSLALGNAMTALGGDLGSIVINPAGSAVSNYSQFTLTPSISVSASKSGFSADLDSPYSNFQTANRTRVDVPDIGFNFVWDTPYSRSLRSVSFGLITNTTRNYYGNMIGVGDNSNSSMFQSMAANSYGYSPSDLETYYGSAPWDYSVAYQSGLISRVSNSDEYVGVTEIVTGNPDGSYDFRVPGTLEQKDRRNTSGIKRDVVMNMGLNFSNNFFLGFSIGMPTIEYAMDERYTETPLNPEDFTFEYEGGNMVSLTRAEYDYSYRATSSGIYGKIGFIWLPAMIEGLRVGAAFQTRTLHEIEEHWQVSGKTTLSDSRYDGQAASPVGDYSYDFRSPARYNVGVAYTLADKALFSVDYEEVDYRKMRFGESYSTVNNFGDVNDDIRNGAAVSRLIRAGVEYKVVPEFAVRAGYSMTTSGNNAVKAVNNAYSFGIGYSSRGSFFADYAVRMSNSTEYISPFMDTLSGDDYYYTPEIKSDRSLFDVVLTLGFRF